MAYVVAKVQTADEVQTVAVAQIYTFLVRRYKAIPLVVVVLTAMTMLEPVAEAAFMSWMAP